MTTSSNILKNLIQERIILLFETFDKDNNYERDVSRINIFVAIRHKIFCWI
jgi:hypothetical protein